MDSDFNTPSAPTDGNGLDRVELLTRFLGPDLCRKLGVFRVPEGFKLSVVIPAYNEVKTIARVVERVRARGCPARCDCR